MTEELTVAAVILPDAHRRAYPQVAGAVDGDTANLLTTEDIGTGEGHDATVGALENVETIIRSDENVAVIVLAEVVGLYVVEEILLPEGVESHSLWVHAGDAVRCSYPQQPGVIDGHRPHPVVAQVAVGATLGHIEDAGLTRIGVVDVESLAVDGDEKGAMAVVGHAVCAVARVAQPPLCGTGGNVVAVKAVAAADPVVALSVAVDDAGTIGRRQMSGDFPVGIKLEDTAVLHGAPHSAVVAAGQRRYAAAYGIVLSGETPARKRRRFVVGEIEALAVAAYPQVVVLVEHEVLGIRCGEVETVGSGLRVGNEGVTTSRGHENAVL